MTTKIKADSTKKMFRDPSGQQDFIEKSYEEELEAKRKQPVECLGRKFANDDARREYFLEELAKKLKDPDFRKIEGFPIGDDEDILALSDPPYYTACPNPWLADFLKEWETRKSRASRKRYSREPFAADVTEGKNDPVYAAHSYHTKVPHPAIMRYILHYTDPGDIVLDGFCGTGMTAVAAQECAHPEKYFDSAELSTIGGKAGARNSIVADLSVLPSFIASNLAGRSSPSVCSQVFGKLLDSVEKELGHLFLSQDDGLLNYCVWSDVFVCGNCTTEIIYWDAAVSIGTGEQPDPFPCPHCKALQKKRSLARAFESTMDPVLGEVYKRAKRVPVYVNIVAGGKRRSCKPTDLDIRNATSLSGKAPPAWVPTVRLPEADRYRKDGLHLVDLSYYHRFYFTRTLHVLSRIWEKIQAIEDHTMRNRLRFAVTSMLDRNLTIRNRFVVNKHNPSGRINGPLANTLYVPGLSVEQNPFVALRYKAAEAFRGLRSTWAPSATSTQSFTGIQIPEESVDYIFVDPPFGHNIMYSELNGLSESWLRVRTNNSDEAIVSESQSKTASEYLALMHQSFRSCLRVLKPGRWMTVEFHNSQNLIWNVIQEAINKAGFVIADVRTLDKKKGTINQEFYTAGAVKQDLVISAYKPTEATTNDFNAVAGTEEGAWAFVRSHLAQLPRCVISRGDIETVTERMGYMLYDRMVAFHVQRGFTVPLSAAEFYRGLDARFPARDQMYFLPDQVVEYDKQRAKCSEIIQFELFVQDEASAIAWLKQQLIQRPQTFQEIHSGFLKEVGGWQKHEKPLELKEILQSNFLCYSGKGDVPSQIHSYLSTNWKDLRGKGKDDPELMTKARDRWYVPDPKKAEDLEKVRERALLREFWEYLPEGHKPHAKPDYQDELPGLGARKADIPVGKRMKVIRTEALRAGFKYCWQNQDYSTIIAVAKRIPEDVLQEDAKLLMWYDQALTRLGEE